MDNYFPPLTLIEQFRTDIYKRFRASCPGVESGRLWRVLDVWQRRLESLPTEQQEQRIEKLMKLKAWDTAELFSLNWTELLDKIDEELHGSNVSGH